MLLSSQLFDRIVGTTGGPGRSSTVLPVGCRRAPERRQVSRMAFGQRTQICRDRGKKAGIWETVMVQDISTKGIGFLCDDPIEHAATFMLKLTDAEGQLIRIRCCVQRCERGGYGNVSFLLGATYVQVIHQQSLRVNDETSRESSWQNTVEPIGLPSDASGLKAMGIAMSRAAMFLRAVDPVRAASQWMKKADDYSSIS